MSDQVLMLVDDLFSALTRVESPKRATIRTGHRPITLGYLRFHSPYGGVQRCLVWVESVEHILFGELDAGHALAEGCASLEDLQEGLISFYPDLEDYSPVTVVHFSNPRMYRKVAQ